MTATAAVTVYLFVIITTPVEVFSTSELYDLCPQDCTCTTSNRNDLLNIDCEDRAMPNTNDSGDTKLEEELNQMLASVTSLTKLTIINTQLSEVPAEVCKKTFLQNFHIDNHPRLKRLPSNCFLRMKDLQVFVARFNGITHLQDDLFDGLLSLRELNLEGNKIESIGQRLFSNTTNLLNLVVIQLNQNMLKYIEPWPFIRGQAVPGVAVNLSFNQIERFTNAIGWKYHIPTAQINMTVDISSNHVHRVSDLIRELNFSSRSDFYWMFTGTFAKSISVRRQIGYICDCQDYSLFVYDQFLQRNQDIKAQSICSNIGSFPNKPSADRFPLDQLVCLVDTRCPPRCHCVNQPSNVTFHILCPNSEQTRLPGDVPPTYLPHSLLKSNHQYYKLDLSGNNISSLEYRYYLNNTIFLDMSNCKLQNITDKALTEMVNIQTIYLHNNSLTALPLATQLLNFTFTKLSLYGNPLSCGCDQIWLKAWLVSVRSRLLNPDGICCSIPKRLNGKSIFTINDEEFCHDPIVDQFETRIWLSIVASLGAALVFIIIGALFMFTFRVKLYAKLGFHPLDRDECEGENLKYDVFISFSHEDRVKARELLSFLETNSLKVCFHERDFRAGESILGEICEAICGSKRVLCLVSNNFMSSHYGMTEFEMAMNHHISINRRRLIIVLTEEFHKDISGTEEEELVDLDRELLVTLPLLNTAIHGSEGCNKKGLLLNFIASNTYVKLGSDNTRWQQQLLYAMPMQRMGGVEVAETEQNCGRNPVQSDQYFDGSVICDIKI